MVENETLFYSFANLANIPSKNYLWHGLCLMYYIVFLCQCFCTSGCRPHSFLPFHSRQMRKTYRHVTGIHLSDEGLVLLMLIKFSFTQMAGHAHINWIGEKLQKLPALDKPISSYLCDLVCFHMYLNLCNPITVATLLWSVWFKIQMKYYPLYDTHAVVEYLDSLLY